MPYVTCPTCGERGKIPPNLVGARIKCRKCGLSFMVAAAGRQGRRRGECFGDVVGERSGPSAVAEPLQGGIEVEGLDASSWALPTETVAMLKSEAVAAAAAEPSTPSRTRARPSSPPSQARPGPRIQAAHVQRQDLRRQVRPRPAGRGPESFRTPGLDRQVDVDSACQRTSPE